MLRKQLGEELETIVACFSSPVLLRVQQQVEPQTVDQRLNAARRRDRIDTVIPPIVDDQATQPLYLGGALFIVSVMNFEIGRTIFRLSPEREPDGKLLR